MAKKGTTKSKKTTAKKTPKTTKIDLDALAAEARTSINATDYQAYLRNRLKGTK